MYSKQQGSLLIAAVMLMTVMALIAGTLAYLFVENAKSASGQLLSTKAFYLAQAGLEVASSAVAVSPLADTTGTASRIGCLALNGNASFTNVSYDAGQFTVTATNYAPSPAKLSAAITAASVVVPMTTVLGYAAMGSVMIESEWIDYGRLGSSSAQCGTGISACLLGAQRGANGTIAAAHATNSVVVQSLCELQSIGGVPNLTNPVATRTIKKSVIFANPQSVGNVSGGDLILDWTGAAWANIGASASIGSYALNGIELVHSSNGWIVGNVTTASCTSTSRALFVFFNGITWTPVCSTNVNQSLNDVACSGTAFCKAVGATNTSIAGWNGTSWSQDTSNSTMPKVTYNDVDCPATNFCVAVGAALTSGAASGKYEVVLTWNGTTWARVNSGAISTATTVANTTTFMGVDCPTSSYCVLVGSGPTIVFYNAGTWSAGSVTGIPAVQYNAVSCVTSTDCWAVGNASGGAVFIHWNGTKWTQFAAAGVPAQNMLGVGCMATDACWAVGANGTAAFWNGTVWANASSGNPVVNINNVGFLKGSFAKDRLFAWREVFN